MLMLLGLTDPTSGTVRVCGFDPAASPEGEEVIGYCLRTSASTRIWMRDRTPVHRPPERIPDRVSARRIAELLEMVDLAKESTRSRLLFEGMKQRLGIAEVLVKEPKVAFLDEPTIGLDPDGTNRMLDLIQSLSRERKMRSSSRRTSLIRCSTSAMRSGS